MDVKYINYATLGMMKKNQIGSNQSGDINDFNYKNGLNTKELAVIDVNSDGAITEEEFKNAFGGTDDEAYKKYWQTYSLYYTASTNEKDVTTQKKNGVKTESTFEDGRMTGYTQTKLNKDGSVEVKTFTYDENEKSYVVSSTVTKFDDGFEIKKNPDGIQEYSWSDGRKEVYDDKGRPLSFTSADGHKYEFTNDEEGFLTALIIGENKYTEMKGVNKDGEVYDETKADHKLEDFQCVGFYEIVETETEDGGKKTEEKLVAILIPTDQGWDIKDYTETEPQVYSFGDIPNNEIEEIIKVDENDPNKTTIKTMCNGVVLKEQFIEMEDGMPLVNELHEYTYAIKNNEDDPDADAAADDLKYLSEEKIKDYISGNTTKLLYKEGSSEPYFTSVRDSKGRMVGGEGTLEGVLKEKYPNLSAVQVAQLAAECARVNEIDVNSTVKFDPVTNDFNIKIPSYRIDPESDNVIFIQGTVSDFLKKQYPDLTEEQLKQLSEECLRINNVSRFYQVTYDPEEEVYSISIPTYIIKEDGQLEFIYEEEEE